MVGVGGGQRQRIFQVRFRKKTSTVNVNDRQRTTTLRVDKATSTECLLCNAQGLLLSDRQRYGYISGEPSSTVKRVTFFRVMSV